MMEYYTNDDHDMQHMSNKGLAILSKLVILIDWVKIAW